MDFRSLSPLSPLGRSSILNSPIGSPASGLLLDGKVFFLIGSINQKAASATVEQYGGTVLKKVTPKNVRRLTHVLAHQRSLGKVKAGSGAALALESGATVVEVDWLYQSVGSRSLKDPMEYRVVIPYIPNVPQASPTTSALSSRTSDASHPASPIRLNIDDVPAAVEDRPKRERPVCPESIVPVSPPRKKPCSWDIPAAKDPAPSKAPVPPRPIQPSFLKGMSACNRAAFANRQRQQPAPSSTTSSRPPPAQPRPATHAAPSTSLSRPTPVNATAQTLTRVTAESQGVTKDPSNRLAFTRKPFARPAATPTVAAPEPRRGVANAPTAGPSRSIPTGRISEERRSSIGSRISNGSETETTEKSAFEKRREYQQRLQGRPGQVAPRRISTNVPVRTTANSGSAHRPPQAQSTNRTLADRRAALTDPSKQRPGPGARHQNSTRTTTASATNSSSKQGRPEEEEETELEKRVKNHPHVKGKVEASAWKQVLGDVVDGSKSVKWEDISGLEHVKAMLHECLILPHQRPDLFTGLRKAAKAILLFGPPGNGKTMLAKAVASQCNATFFSISASSLTSKFVGEGEKLMKAMFAVARALQPSVIFIDEVDSLLSARGGNEHEASRRLKTEYLCQMDGVGTDENDRVVILGATNRPHDLDDAVIRRFTKRVYIPLLDGPTRRALLEHLLSTSNCDLCPSSWDKIIASTEGYSGSDLSSLCHDAALQPIRELGAKAATVPADEIRPIGLKDFEKSLTNIRKSVSPELMGTMQRWNAEYGSSA